MLVIKVECADLLHWIGYARQSVPPRMAFEVARALNEAGETLAEQLARRIASENNMGPDQAHGLISVSRASPGNPSFTLNTTAAHQLEFPQGRQFGRRTWQQRPDNFFRADEMVKIVTRGDELVCPICQDLEGTVHTIEEARALLPAHQNCRCAVVPAQFRRLPVTYATRFGAAPRGHQETISLTGLANKLRDVAKIVLKAV